MNFYYIIAIICTALSIFIQYIQPKNKIFHFIVAIFTIAIMILTYLAAKKDGEVSENSLKEMITYQTSEIKRLSEENIRLSQVIYKNTNQLTGNGSYPIGQVAGGKKNAVQIIIGVNGEFALPNLTARIVSIPDYKKISGLDLRTAGITNPTIPLGTIRKNEMKYFFADTRTKETAVIIYFKSDNYSWIQSMRIIITPKGRRSFWFITDDNGKIIDKHIDDDFPKNNDGKVVLWSNEIKLFEEL
jgi:hypothetical protein